jgi:monoamine oxidase
VSRSDVDLVIIGGGAAGIAAARHAAAHPVSYRLLEAAPRVGGRALTHVTESGIALDRGCGWLHSADRNSWRAQAEATGFTVDRTPPPWGTQACDHGMSAAEQAAFGAAYDAWERRTLAAAGEPDRAAAELLEPGCRWNPLIDALSAYINGAGTAALSVHDYAAYANADTGVNWRVAEGYGALVAAAASGLDVSLDTPVEAIDHSGERLRIRTGRGTIEARAAIVAVPTPILAEGRLRFVPELPAKREAAAGLPLGLANKLHLALDEPGLFPADSHLFGRTDTRETCSYHLRPLGRPLVEVYAGGDHAEALERDPPALADFAVEELVALVGSDLRRRLRPLAPPTRWRAEPLIRGSYSHALPGRAGDRATLAAPVDSRLFFAGEACSTHDFSTAHGAHDSGVAAATAALAALGIAPQKAPNRPA